jgi:hypothetical protein
MKNSALLTKKIFNHLSLICSVVFIVSCTNIPISVITPQTTTHLSQVASTTSGTTAFSQATKNSSTPVGVVGQEIPYVSLSKSFHLGSSLPDPALLLVFDSQGLKNINTLVSEADRSLVQTIDFEKQYLLGAFWGVQPAGGYSITIDHVYINGDELVVEVLLQENDPEFPKIDAVTSPYHLVTVEKSLLSDKIQRFQMVSDNEILASGPIR